MPPCRAPSATSSATATRATTTAYKIEGGKLVIPVAQDPYSFTFYKLGDTYYAARSNEFGYANYEIIPAPQIAANPLTALSNQFSIELGLTEEQKKQIVPILQQELKQLGALKKNTTLSGLQKVEALRKLGVSFDEKISPLLNPDQQQKFQTMREEMRRKMIEEMAEQALQKAKSESSGCSPTCTGSAEEPGGESAWIRRSGSGCLPCPRPALSHATAEARPRWHHRGRRRILLRTP